MAKLMVDWIHVMMAHYSVDSRACLMKTSMDSMSGILMDSLMAIQMLPMSEIQKNHVTGGMMTMY